MLMSLKKGKIKNNSQLCILIAIFFGFFVLMSVLMPGTFLRLGTMQSMMVQLPEFGIYALAMMFAMILGGIDLSIVSIGNLSSIIASQFMLRYMIANAGETENLRVVVQGICIALAVGALCGIFNGVSVAVVGIPPMLATLASMSIFNGISTVLTKGASLQGLPEEYALIGKSTLFGIIPIIIVIFLLAACIAYVIQKRTKLGMKMFLVGSNARAAQFSGINNHFVIITAYLLSGVLSSLAGIIMTSRSMSAKMDYGIIYQLQAILAVVLGGVSPKGGIGSVGGVVMAVLSLQVLSTGLNILNLASTSYVKNLIWGLFLVVVLLMNYYADTKKRKGKI